MPFDVLVEKSREYYEETLQRFGCTPRGVDWNDEASQNLRFKILTEIGDLNGTRIHDVGCGLGHLADYFLKRRIDVDYVGTDISATMVERARERRPGCKIHTADILAAPNPEWMKADYLMASGLFYVKSEAPDQAWQAFVEAMVMRMFQLAGKGIAFNMLTSHVDYEESHLFYASPSRMLDFCLSRLGRHVVIRHDYPLYEYTVYAYKA